MWPPGWLQEEIGGKCCPTHPLSLPPDCEMSWENKETIAVHYELLANSKCCWVPPINCWDSSVACRAQSSLRWSLGKVLLLRLNNLLVLRNLVIILHTSSPIFSWHHKDGFTALESRKQVYQPMNQKKIITDYLSQSSMIIIILVLKKKIKVSINRQQYQSVDRNVIILIIYFNIFNKYVLVLLTMSLLTPAF